MKYNVGQTVYTISIIDDITEYTESGIEGECGIMCFSLDFAKKCLGV